MLKGTTVAFWNSLSQRLTNPVISNAHTPLISQAVCVSRIACSMWPRWWCLPNAQASVGRRPGKPGHDRPL